MRGSYSPLKGWWKSTFEAQSGCSARHGHVFLCRCMETGCLFNVSPDRKDNLNPEHSQENCELVTLGENLGEYIVLRHCVFRDVIIDLCVCV